MSGSVAPLPTVEQVIAALNARWWTHAGTASTARRDAEEILSGHDRSSTGRSLPTLADLGLDTTTTRPGAGGDGTRAVLPSQVVPEQPSSSNVTLARTVAHDAA